MSAHNTNKYHIKLIHVRYLHHRWWGQQSPPRLLSGDLRALDKLLLPPTQHEAQGHRPRHDGTKEIDNIKGDLCLNLSYLLISITKIITPLGRCFTIFDSLSGVPFFQRSSLTYSCRRSHHTLNQNISCGGWGEEQTKRTCEIYYPGEGWYKEDYLLDAAVEHQTWMTQHFDWNLEIAGPIHLVIMNGDGTLIVRPGVSFKKEWKSSKIFIFL